MAYPEIITDPSAIGGVPIAPRGVERQVPLDEKALRIRDAVGSAFGDEVLDVVFALSGGMYYDAGRGIYRTTSYSQLTEHGQATGSRLRAIATAAIAHAIPEATIVTNSFNRFDPDEPTMASCTPSEFRTSPM